jgi:protein TonB
MPSQTGTRREQAPATTAERREQAPAASPSTSMALTLDGYKRDLARQICNVNSSKVYPERPQALLRSVIVIKYTVDSDGRLLHADVLRSNHDRATEATALSSLHNSSPFPKPLPYLVHNGRVEISETWLFNNDGRFQLRTIALPQMGDE